MFVHSGFQNYIAVDKILTISRSDSTPMRRQVALARDAGYLIDHTMGKERKAVVSLTTGHVVIVPVEPETLNGRVSKLKRGE